MTPFLSAPLRLLLYREAHTLLEASADATLDGNRKQHMELLTVVPLLIIDDLGVKRLPLTAAEELLEIINAKLRTRQYADCLKQKMRCTAFSVLD